MVHGTDPYLKHQTLSNADDADHAAGLVTMQINVVSTPQVSLLRVPTPIYRGTALPPAAAYAATLDRPPISFL